MACIAMSQIAPAMLRVFDEIPEFDHGEMADKPSPVPSDSRISPIAAATNAPPAIAGHDTADTGASSTGVRLDPVDPA
jgi:hypothetical protein